MFRLIFPESYEEKVKRFLKKHPEIKSAYEKTLQLLELNPHHPSLRLHKFRIRSFEGYSVSINMSYRIAVEIIISEKEILFVNIGDHQEIYGKK